MDALAEVERSLTGTCGSLSPIEFRTLMWARCSLASLYGIRIDETLDDTSLCEIEALLDRVELTDRAELANRAGSRAD